MTKTPGSEMSGYASSLSWVKDQIPATAIARTAKMMTTRWWSENSSTRGSIGLLASQQDCAIDDDAALHVQTARDRHDIPRSDAGRNHSALELARPALHEYLRAPVLLDDRGGRDRREPPRRSGMAHGAEHLGDEPPRRVEEVHLDLECARLRIEGAPNTGDAASELLPRIGDEGDLDGFPDVNQPHERLWDVRRDPYRAQVSDRHEWGRAVCGGRDGGPV